MAVENLTKISVNEITDIDYQIVHTNALISKAIGKMLKYKQFELPVVERNGILEGMLSYNSLIKTGSIAMNEKVETIQLNTPKLKPNDSVGKAAELFLSTDFRLLPVVKNRKIIGVVRRWKIIEMARELKTWKKMKVTEIMSRDIKTVKINEKVSHARNLLRKLDVKAIPVVDKNDELAGIIGISDIISYLRPKRRAKSGAYIGEKTNFDPEVRDVMVPEPIHVSSEASVSKVIKLMLDKDISTIVVVEDKKVVGIVTGFDILEYIVSAGRKKDSVFINISGLNEEDPHLLDSLFELLEGSMKKINKIFPPRVLNIHVHSYNVEGNETKYSVNMRLTTDKHLFVTKGIDWDIFRAFSDAVERLLIQARKKKEMMKEHKKIKFKNVEII